MTRETGHGRADHRHHRARRGQARDAPNTGDFAPQISTHQVATLTLGRQVFNDSDKSNYFEG